MGLKFVTPFFVIAHPTEIARYTIGTLYILGMQPLKDNLDSATYEVFEKDPIKYVCYEKVRKVNIQCTSP